MPLVQISIIEGRSPEQKEKLISAITDAVNKSIQAPPAAIRVLINEMPAAHWGVAGVSKAKQQEESK